MDKHLTDKINLFLQIIIGILFIFSAVSKLFPVEAFDFTLVSKGITTWQIAPYLSRIIIAIELTIGVSFLIGKNLKKLFIPAAFILLLIFSIHLTFQIFKNGNAGNCGCFGQLLPMSNLSALIKNFILLLILIYLYKAKTTGDKINTVLPAVTFVVLAGLIFLIFQVKAYNMPVSSQSAGQLKSLEKDSAVIKPSDTISGKGQEYSSSSEQKINNETTENKPSEYKQVTSIFSEFNDFGTGAKVDIDKGKKILAFFSLDCEDCMNTAKKLTEIGRETELPPVYILFLGEQKQVQNFFNFAGKKYPYRIIPPQSFFPFIKDYPPRVVLLFKGNIIGDWDYSTFNENKLQSTLSSLP